MPTFRSSLFSKMAIVVALALAITVAHYATTTHLPRLHHVYRRLYYLPIVLAALWFGLRGGLASSVLISIAFLPHVILQWGGNLLSDNLEQTLEIALYNIMGGLTGLLSDRQKHEAQRYRDIAAELDKSYHDLKRQTTALLDAEEQLRRADRLSALGELAAGIAHEVRNPLGSILGTAEIFRDRFKPEEKEHEFADILVEETRRLNKVVTSFLEFARPTQFQTKEAQVNEVLESVLALVDSETVKKDICVEKHLAAGLPPVRLDPEQLKQVCVNLVLNAIQAIEERGTIAVRSWQANGRVNFAVRDTGCGIPQEHIEKLFDPFFTTKEKGTGLGLSIVKKTLDHHGAKIAVESRVGVGTEFVVTFPERMEEK